METEKTTTNLKNQLTTEKTDGKMDGDLDERVFALMNRAIPGTIGAIGMIEKHDEKGKPDALVGVYFDWANKKNASDLIYELGYCFGEARFSTLGSNFSPGLVAKMQITAPLLRQVSEDSIGFKKIRLSLMEIRASDPKTILSLYYDGAKMFWTYKPVSELDYSDTTTGYVPRMENQR